MVCVCVCGLKIMRDAPKYHILEKTCQYPEKRGFYPPPLVPKLIGPGLKGALVPVRAPGARPAPSPGS
jgi:hypothetical protein